jgi:hypothetical protein
MRRKENNTAGQKFACKYKSTLAACFTTGDEEPLFSPSSINKGVNNPNPITAKNRKILKKEEHKNLY